MIRHLSEHEGLVAAPGAKLLLGCYSVLPACLQRVLHRPARVSAPSSAQDGSVEWALDDGEVPSTLGSHESNEPLASLRSALQRAREAAFEMHRILVAGASVIGVTPMLREEYGDARRMTIDDIRLRYDVLSLAIRSLEYAVSTGTARAAVVSGRLGVIDWGILSSELQRPDLVIVGRHSLRPAGDTAVSRDEFSTPEESPAAESDPVIDAQSPIAPDVADAPPPAPAPEAPSSVDPMETDAGASQREQQVHEPVTRSPAEVSVENVLHRLVLVRSPAEVERLVAWLRRARGSVSPAQSRVIDERIESIKPRVRVLRTIERARQEFNAGEQRAVLIAAREQTSDPALIQLIDRELAALGPSGPSGTSSEIEELRSRLDAIEVVLAAGGAVDPEEVRWVRERVESLDAELPEDGDRIEVVDLGSRVSRIVRRVEVEESVVGPGMNPDSPTPRSGCLASGCFSVRALIALMLALMLALILLLMARQLVCQCTGNGAAEVTFGGLAVHGDRVVLVLDRSKSMALNGGWVALRVEVERFLQSMGPRRAVGVVLFDGGTYSDLLAPPAPCTAETRVAIMAGLASEIPDGGTNPGGAIAHALSDMMPSTIVLLSDGGFDPAETLAAMATIDPAGIVQVNTVWLEMAFALRSHPSEDRSALQAIATAGHSEFRVFEPAGRGRP